VVANGATAVADVGSLPSGNGLWGHTDLIGNVYEWVLDHFANYTVGGNRPIPDAWTEGWRSAHAQHVTVVG
jgi:formylglycine-generating enzyme required for sulfatase activity